jgi:hypothetical protein
LLVSELRYIGLAQDIVRAGDAIVVFLGSSMPYVLRAKGAEYELLGECFVHGLMDGQGLELRNGEGDYNTFVLI